MMDLNKVAAAVEPGQPFVAQAEEPVFEEPVLTDPAAQMTGFMAVKVTLDGRSRTLWQDIRGGVVQGFVDRSGRAVALAGCLEASVVDGVLLDSPASKGEHA
jgi:hypothetical protein